MPIRSILGLLADLYLHARGAPLSPTCKVRVRPRFANIVRTAEERFASASGGAVSLADLCAAAGVSQGTLYNAFRVMCDCSPMEYFKKRRLTEAREALLHTTPGRGSVKRAALDAGLTHLGRFALEYRHLFGEAPTTTLNKPVERRLEAERFVPPASAVTLPTPAVGARRRPV